MAVDKEFLGYVENAMQQYAEYHKVKDVTKLEFRDFLLLILVWKLESVLETLEDEK